MDVVSIVFDALLVAIVVIGMIVGIRRGFVKTVAKPVKFVASLLFAYYACGFVSDNYIKGFIQAPIANHLKTFLQERCAGLTAENVSSELPTLLKLSAVVSGKDINEIVGNSTTGVLDSIVSELTDPIVHVIGIIVSFIIVYIVARIIFTLLVLLIDVIVSKGPLGIINKALGFVFGLAFSVIIAWVLVAVSEFAMGFVGYKFDAGAVYEFLNGFNPLDLLLSF